MSKLLENPSWLKAVCQCIEQAFIVDEVTKTLLWCNDPAVSPGQPCYKAFFGKDAPCAFCPTLTLGKMYPWECYDEHAKRWLKVKSIMFLHGDRLLRASNLSCIDDAMALNRESMEQLSALQKLQEENLRYRRTLENEASHDRMTGLLNRNQFNLDIASGLYDRAGTGVLYFDLNNLKEVNDLYRHEAGDRLIMQLADAISETAKQLDAARVYRIGGDEFVLMMNGEEAALHGAHTFFEDYLATRQTEPPCIAAVGEAYTQTGCDAESLVSSADRAMYADKRRMKGQ